MRRLVVLALLVVACRHHESPTDPIVNTTSAALIGRVYYSESGRGVAEAQVIARPDARTRETVTDEEGRYRLFGLPAGPVEIEARGPNQTDSRVIFQVRLDSGTNKVDLPISSNGCVTLYGFVRDANTHQGIDGAMVYIAGSARTNADGSFALVTGCPPHYIGSTLGVIVEHPDYKRYSSFLRGPYFSMKLQDILMQPR